MSDEEIISDIETRQYCHTCGLNYKGKECTRRELHRKIERFRASDPPSYTEQEWTKMHEVPCATCNQPGRLYPSGAHCVNHPPVGSAAR